MHHLITEVPAKKGGVLETKNKVHRGKYKTLAKFRQKYFKAKVKSTNKT